MTTITTHLWEYFKVAKEPTESVLNGQSWAIEQDQQIILNYDPKYTITIHESVLV